MAEKKTHQIHEFEVGIYPRVLWVAVGVPIAEQRALFGDELPDMDDSADAEVAVVRAEKPKPRGGVLVRFESRKAMTDEVIAHESTHAAIEIFNYCDCLISHDNQEPFAYLCGWIAKMCGKVKRGKYED